MDLARGFWCIGQGGKDWEDQDSERAPPFGRPPLPPHTTITNTHKLPHSQTPGPRAVQRRLVPRISRAMRSGAGPRRGLREREAVVLLRASLDPEALLEAGKLREFYDTLLVC